MASIAKCTGLLLLAITTLSACSNASQRAGGTSSATAAIRAWSTADLFNSFAKLSEGQRQSVGAAIESLTMPQYFAAVKAILTDDAVSVDGVGFTNSQTSFAHLESRFAAAGKQYPSFGVFARASHTASVTSPNLAAFKAEILDRPTGLNLATLPENVLPNVSYGDQQLCFSDLASAAGQTQMQLADAVGRGLDALKQTTQPAAKVQVSFDPSKPVTVVEGATSKDLKTTEQSEGIWIGFNSRGTNGRINDGVYNDSVEDFAKNGELPYDSDAGGDPYGHLTLLHCLDNTPVTNPSNFPNMPSNNSYH